MSTPVTSVTTASERALAGGQWLLGAAPSRQEARASWEENGSAWLRPGVLFGAITMPAGLVHAALGEGSPLECATALDVRLCGGPVFYGERGFGPEGGYTALVPASAAMMWSAPGATPHHHKALLEVPAPELVRPERTMSWWVVQLDGPGTLCEPALLAALVAQGYNALADAKAAAQDG
ncbi:hypothetical protein ACN24M_39265 [Streptomyces microflavus]|uniref:hypothetical protein n=1 Tax=Streptomyces microflavus TaxID=1919 RepID=UPI003B215B9A